MNDSVVQSRALPMHRTPWFGLALGLVLLTGLMVAVALTYLRARTLQNAQQLNQTMVQVVAEQTTRTLQTVDQRLELTAEKMALLLASGRFSAPLVDAMYQGQLKELPFVRAFWYVDLQGEVLYDSQRNANSPTVAATFLRRTKDLQVFQTQPGTHFLLDAPLKHDPRGEWLIHAARPIRSAAGVLQGSLVADIDPKYFDVLWRSINYGNGGAVVLVRQDGTLMIRSPFTEESMAKNFKGRPLFTTLLPAASHGSYQDTSAIDGVQRLSSYRRLSTYPELVIVLGQSVEQILLPWWQWAQLVLGVWAAACVMVLALSGFLARAGALRRKSEQVLRASEERFHALYESSLDAILLTSPEGRVLSANPAARQMFDRTEPEICALGRSGLLDVTDPRLAKALEIRAATGQFKGELTFVRKDGTQFSGEVFASIFKDSQGQARSAMIIRDRTERNLAEAALRDNADKLQSLTRRVIEAQEAERRRVASELHDELGQALTAIKINLQSGERFRGRYAVNINQENIRIVDDALQHMRQLALALRPSILDNLGLTPALNWLGKQMATRTGCRFEFEPVVLKNRLAAELETTCFRIVQEALTNITRHAQAQRVRVAMSVQAGQLSVMVSDDGQGFDPVQAHQACLAGKSFGLLGMLERAALVGGQIDLAAAPGQGCCLTLRCPMTLSPEAP